MFVCGMPGTHGLSSEISRFNYSIDSRVDTNSVNRGGLGVEAFVFGEVVYPLKTPTSLRFEAGRMPFASLGLCGTGQTSSEAFKDLSQTVHSEFQTLSQKLPLDRTSEDQERLNKFAAVLDIDRYLEIKREIRRTVAKVAKRSRESGLLLQVDETFEWLKWDQLPPEAGGLQQGQYMLGTFVKKQGRIVECVDAIRIGNVDRVLTAEEIDREMEPSDLPDDDAWPLANDAAH
jgi:hypothetical protein